MDKIQMLRFTALKNINFPMHIIKKIIKDKFDEEILESNIDSFIKNIKRYQVCEKINEILYLIEKNAFKKLLIFDLKEKELEELDNEVFKQEFIRRNMMLNCKNENLRGIGEDFKCIYYKDTSRYFTIKMALIKKAEIDDIEESFTVTKDYEYYDFVKFIIDKDESIVFMFYNDINSIAEFEEASKDKAITYKKYCFYNMFSKGNQASLKKYSIDEELNTYVIDILKEIDDEKEEFTIKKTIPIIETEDPVDSKNNLRSSKRDARHNKFRLQAIKYALENEEHNVKNIECLINGRYICFKNRGEIILQVPYFGMEVIEDVCKEVFPKYRIASREEEATGTDNL